MLLLIADENFPLPSYRLLEERGYDIEHILLNSPGIPDDEVIKIAIENNRIILTFDSDIGELVFKSGYKPIGVIYFRWKSFRPNAPGEFLDDLIKQKSITFEGFFTVIDEGQIRQRKI